ncbi:hypothetical protein LINGRAHAP2_LOCUS34642 [Linum grandiflorum]
MWQLLTSPMVRSSLGQLSISKWLRRRQRGPSLLSSRLTKRGGPRLSGPRVKVKLPS